jgi:hypothetical protein
MSDAVTSVVMTGRRIQVSEMFTSGSCLFWLADRYARPVSQLQMSVGDDDIAVVHP